jgi:hypothetical protein
LVVKTEDRAHRHPSPATIDIANDVGIVSKISIVPLSPLKSTILP